MNGLICEPMWTDVLNASSSVSKTENTKSAWELSDEPNWMERNETEQGTERKRVSIRFHFLSLLRTMQICPKADNNKNRTRKARSEISI